jgi:C1A family cysteine protease
MARNIFLLALLGSVMTASAVNSLTADWLLKHEFETFKTKFSVTYGTPEEEAYRFQVFKSTIERVARMNKEHNTDAFGVTRFADLTEDEFRSKYLSTLPSHLDAPVHQPKSTVSVSDLDWRNENVITPVKNQGNCGSCWAHSTVETIESAWAIAKNPLTEFSVQQVTSCSTANYGCRGGWPSVAYEYVESAGGLATAASYPYVDGSHFYYTTPCTNSFTVAGGQVTGWSYATTACTSGSCSNQDETTMINNLGTQPISIIVDASQWSSYTGGSSSNTVFPTSSCSSAYNSLDHAVQLVGISGYGTSSGYYIVRNSWDTTWGISGYIYLSIGANACGIADLPTMVTVA